MARSKTAVKSKINTKMIVATVVLVGILGSAFAGMAVYRNRGQFRIERFMPRKAEITAGTDIKLGEFVFTSKVRNEDGFILVDRILFNTKGDKYIKDKVKNIRLYEEIEGNCDPGQCIYELARVDGINPNNGRVAFNIGGLPIFNNRRTHIIIKGDIENFSLGNSKKNPKLEFYVKNRKHIVAYLRKDTGRGYGYGYGYEETLRIYPRNGARKGTILSVSPDVCNPVP